MPLPTRGAAARGVQNAKGKGDPFGGDGKKSKSAGHEVGPGRRANAKERRVDTSGVANPQQAIIDHYDKSGRGKLAGKEILDLMNMLGSGETVNIDEVNWILQIADKDADGMVGAEEVRDVKAALKQYLKTRQRVIQMYEALDEASMKNGLIGRNVLQELLVKLNDGLTVDMSEVEWVYECAGKMPHHGASKTELEQAICFWYNHAEVEDPQPPNDRKKGGAVGRAVTAHSQRTAKK
eukprot:gnl/MRDRNA2_/MRDRNA2_132689_c0_seq1.p1 gnl/MRDRNA2_/MRDRNA2_132689_c0~~gnl/MRDRNA2_/MRDRNA2_132689_c0_seq1.p1  ORF type:complete len:247 (+),score=44.15 gnl/MRDRNA2_/MRDRNA2_132689_c0_seq1:33-743(+)